MRSCQMILGDMISIAHCLSKYARAIGIVECHSDGAGTIPNSARFTVLPARYVWLTYACCSASFHFSRASGVFSLPSGASRASYRDVSMPLRGCLASIRASSASMAGEKVVFGAAGRDGCRVLLCSGAAEASSEATREAIDADSAGVGETSMSRNC